MSGKLDLGPDFDGLNRIGLIIPNILVTTKLKFQAKGKPFLQITVSHSKLELNAALNTRRANHGCSQSFCCTSQKKEPKNPCSVYYSKTIPHAVCPNRTRDFLEEL